MRGRIPAHVNPRPWPENDSVWGGKITSSLRLPLVEMGIAWKENSLAGFQEMTQRNRAQPIPPSSIETIFSCSVTLTFLLQLSAQYLR